MGEAEAHEYQAHITELQGTVDEQRRAEDEFKALACGSKGTTQAAFDADDGADEGAKPKSMSALKNVMGNMKNARLRDNVECAETQIHDLQTQVAEVQKKLQASENDRA